MLLLILICPIKINALTGNVKIECNKSTISSGDSLLCTIVGSNFNDQISSFHAKLSLDNNLMSESIEKDTSWEGSTEDGVIDLYTDENKSGNINFVSFVIKLNNKNTNANVNIALEDIKIGDSQFVEHNINNVYTEIKVISNDGDINNEDSNKEDTDNNNQDVTDNKNEIINQDKNNNNIDNNVDNPATGDMKISIIVVIMIIMVIFIIIYIKKYGTKNILNKKD